MCVVHSFKCTILLSKSNGMHHMIKIPKGAKTVCSTYQIKRGVITKFNGPPNYSSLNATDYH